jgi:hypothetical protein
MRVGFRSLLAISLLAASTGGCDWMKKKETPPSQSKAELAAAQRERIRKACASEGTYARLKELVFDEAARIRKSDPRNLDPLAAAAVVRMEDPVVKTRDEALNVTVCSGRFVLELPPGAENAFGGKRRLTADIEYAAQAAADGSGLVYQMDGAEPIVYRLATVGLQGPPPTMNLPAATRAAPPAASLRVTARPSFSCRYAKTRTEKMVCASPALAARDREMASLFYALLAGADPATRAHLRRSRNAFLAERERCGSESCVAAAYTARVAELRSIERGD